MKKSAAPFLIALALTTPWEAGGGNRTPRHVETVAFCRELAAALDLNGISTTVIHHVRGSIKGEAALLLPEGRNTLSWTCIPYSLQW